MGSSKIDELKEDFSLFDDWEERYRYLIELGDKLPEFPTEFQTDEFFVPGCVSKVWMVPEFKDDRFFFIADSNGDITKGMIYILYLAYNDLPMKDVHTVNIEGIFEDLGLANHITAQRRNGFYAMVQRIKSYGSAEEGEKGSIGSEGGM